MHQKFIDTGSHPGRFASVLTAVLFFASLVFAIASDAEETATRSTEPGDSTHVWGRLYDGPDSSRATVPVTFSIEGFRNDDGMVFYAIYDQEDGFPRDTTAVIAGGYSLIEQGRSVITFPLPAGQPLAMIYFHDENSNGELDSNWLHIPKEGYGTSTRRKSGGPPDWDDAVFTLEGEPVKQDLEVKYW